MDNNTFTLAMAQNYSAAYGVDFTNLGQREQEMWIDKLLGVSTEDEDYLMLLGGMGANDDFDEVWQ
ncbi:hypothetical protein ADT27_13390 [Xanthomonas oryzae]|uniref:hypothetical protein n=1 Tax=Xanthomonas oryzae TaxID=347 RepID=UPI0006AC0208|nr:hypothetical protein [Xanthomonas oryzae]KOR44986.1 hypothetical protein ADT27_13390 [Xanthomonas oryzae]